MSRYRSKEEPSTLTSTGLVFWLLKKTSPPFPSKYKINFRANLIYLEINKLTNALYFNKCIILERKLFIMIKIKEILQLAVPLISKKLSSSLLDSIHFLLNFFHGAFRGKIGQTTAACKIQVVSTCSRDNC